MSHPDLTKLLMLAALLAAAALEETVFRAGLQQWLMDRSWGSLRLGALTAANGACAAAFALAHGLSRSWLLALGVLAPALLLGWIYEQRQSLTTCVAVHALMNGAWWCRWAWLT
jgi:membrane protease YdiL (CAAX protease family)